MKRQRIVLVGSWGVAALLGLGLLVHAVLLTVGISHPLGPWFANEDLAADDEESDERIREPLDTSVLERLFEENARARAAGLGMGSERLTGDDVRDSFEYVIGNLETVADSRKRLSRKQWEASYRAANDAFAVYSMHVDGPELEEAHRRLKDTLARIRVRGGRKFEP